MDSSKRNNISTAFQYKQICWWIKTDIAVWFFLGVLALHTAVFCVLYLYMFINVEIFLQCLKKGNTDSGRRFNASLAFYYVFPIKVIIWLFFHSLVLYPKLWVNTSHKSNSFSSCRVFSSMFHYSYVRCHCLYIILSY